MPQVSSYIRTLDSEDQLLVACCAAAVRPEQTDLADVGPDIDIDLDTVDWRGFVTRARWHGVHGTIYPVVAAQLRPAIPEEPWNWLRRLSNGQARHNLAVAETLADVAEVFDREGVGYTVIKGLPLAQKLYGTITARRCRDIDLLVRPADFERARALLEGLGYASKHGFTAAQDRVWLRHAADLPMVNADRRVLVELHHLFEMRPAAAARQCVADLLACSRPSSVARFEVPAPLGPELIPYLAWHGSKHAWFRLFWLLDIAALELRAGIDDREAIWDAAVRLRQERALALAWWLSAALFGVPGVAPHVSAAEARQVEWLGREVLANAFGPVQPLAPHTLARRTRALRWEWSASRGGAQKLAVVRDYLLSVQPDDIRALPLPRSLHWFYPVLRPVRVAWRLGIGLARAAIVGLRGRRQDPVVDPAAREP